MKVIGGLFKNHRLNTPKGLSSRPSTSMVREAIFNILQHDIVDSYFLDAFAGSGAMGIEALSRGALFSAFIDSSKAAIKAVQSNLSSLKISDEQSIVLKKPASAGFYVLKSKGLSFDIIYLDPPFIKEGNNSSNIYQETIDLIIKYDLLSKGGRLFLEGAKESRDHLPQEIDSLEFNKERSFGSISLLEFRN
ncbi:MAG: 16S rRNA (guanine(966)-N(2))-methyltransferase RsmD [Chlamydiales bacterium]|nr:16S rRNA (guanine(966)-N(2))-methyltransferase RsmD [Chlamydiales bacterium]NCF70478.1 16S rRNA (guanine(966)-N(2))-methyltransferase RsmD [Chlamydiales bacterium]